MALVREGMDVHKVFISYHHDNDQWYKEELVRSGEQNRIFMNESVDIGDIPDHLSDQQIRKIIRDERLRLSTVTIVLVGTETRRRKHVDWEIYSSMYDGAVNKKSGILVIMLPPTDYGSLHVSHGLPEKALYPDITSWTSIHSRAEYERRYPYMPDRLIDNLVKPEAKISVTSWNRINPTSLRFLVEAAFQNRNHCEYDLSRSMRRVNS